MSLPFAAPGRTLKRLILLLLAINLFLLGCYIVLDYQILLHAGSAQSSLLAQEMRETRQFLPAGWQFADDSLWGIAGAALSLPLLAVLPNGFAVHAIGSFLSAVLVLWGTWLVTAVLGQSRNVRLTSLLVVASGLSVTMAEHLFGLPTAGLMYAAGCFLFYLSWRYFQAGGRSRIGWGAGAAVLLALAFLLDPQHALVAYCLPLSVGALVMRWQALDGRIGPLPARRFAILGWLLAILAAGLAGSGLHALASAGLPAGAGESVWLGFDGMLGSLRALLQGLLDAFGALAPAGSRVASPLGLYHVLRFFAVLSLLALLPWALWTMLGTRLAPRLYFAVFTLAVTLPALFGAVATGTDGQGFDIRELVPPLMFLLLVLMTATVEENHGRLSGVLGRAVVLVLASSAIVTYTLPLPGTHEGGRVRLAAFLKEQGLSYGFANAAQAGPLTVLASHRVKVRPVEWQGGLPLPTRQQASTRWYRPDAWDGSVFLLMSAAEAQALDWNQLQELAGRAPRRLHFEGWQIAVFERHFARFLPAWNPDLAVPLNLSIGKRSLHRIGNYDAAAKRLQAGEGESGLLHFGPYLALPAGRYSVTVDLEAKSEEEVLDYGTLDVASAKGTHTHVRRPISHAGRYRETLIFTLDAPVRDLEVRVGSNGAGELGLYGLELARLP